MTKTLLRNSERGAFKRCRFMWHLNFNGVEGTPLRSREPAKALWFGDLIHQGLAAYYKPGIKRGPHPAKTFIKLYDADERISAVLRDDEGEWQSMRDLGRGMLEGYVETYREKDEEWKVLASEQTFRLPLTLPEHRVEDPDTGELLLSLPEIEVILVGTVDGLWEHRKNKKRKAFKEFKTAASINTAALAMDDQAGFYWTYGPRWMWRQAILPKKVYPSEILYTFLRKAIPNPDNVYNEFGHKLNKPTKDDLLAAFPRLVDEKMGLAKMVEVIGEEKAAKAGQPSKVQPAPFFERLPVYRDSADRENLHERVVEEAREMWMARKGLLVPIKNPGPLHSPNCAFCFVREACELHESGNDWRAMLDATTEPWDPYEAHEIIERR